MNYPHSRQKDMTLFEAIVVLVEEEYIGDFIYQIRDRELKGWDGPRVTAFNDAVERLEKYLKDERAKPI